MRRFDQQAAALVKAQQSHRAADRTRRKIGSTGPEGRGGRARHRAPHCGAVAGMSVHGPMT